MDIIERVRTIEWFSRVGEDLTVPYNAEVIRLSNWNDASRECASPEWEEAQILARNATTEYLNKHHKSEFQKWNLYANEAKQLLSGDFERLQRSLVGLNVEASVVESVKWDILHAVIEEQYRQLKSPTFFLELFPFYETGHFPCGWRGEWPDGALVVY